MAGSALVVCLIILNTGGLMAQAGLSQRLRQTNSPHMLLQKATLRSLLTPVKRHIKYTAFTSCTCCIKIISGLINSPID